MTFLSRLRSNLHGDRQLQPPPAAATATSTTSSGNNSTTSLPPPPRSSALPPPPRGGLSRSTTPRPNGGSSSTSNTSTRNTTGQWNDTPGAPLRRPQLWRSSSQTWTPARLTAERAAFWDTRVQGRAEAWAALRVAVEMSQAEDDAGAAAILEAAGMSCTTGRLNEGVWDETGQLYKLPRWVVSDPTNVEDDAQEESKQAEAQQKVEAKQSAPQDETQLATSPDGSRQRVALRARLSDKGGDLLLKVEADEPARSIAARIVESGNVADGARVRLAFMGKILKDGDSLADLGWGEGQVVNALVFPPDPEAR